jgi:hypothetical protein
VSSDVIDADALSDAYALTETDSVSPSVSLSVDVASSSSIVFGWKQALNPSGRAITRNERPLMGRSSQAPSATTSVKTNGEALSLHEQTL